MSEDRERAAEPGDPDADAEGGQATPALGLWATLAILFGYLRGHARVALPLFAAIVVEVAFDSLQSLSLKFMIDWAVIPKNGRLLAIIAALFALGFLIASATAVYRDYLYALLAGRVLDDLRRRMFEQLQRLGLGWFARVQTPDLVSRFSGDLSSIEGALVLGIPSALVSVLSTAVSVALLFALEWRLAVPAVLLLPLCALGPRLLGPRALDAGRSLRREQGRMASAIQENLSAQPVIKAFSLGEPLLRAFRERAARVLGLSVRFNFLSYLTERVPNMTMLFLTLGIVVGGAILAYRGELPIGSLVAFHAIFVNLSLCVMTLTSFAPTLLQAVSGIERVEEILREPPSLVEAAGAREMGPFSRAVRFESVDFSYTGKEKQLSGVSYEIPQGARVALVGPSGCGKSTNLGLLLRFHEPSSGRVLFDETDLREAATDSVRRQMGVVFQESFLFDSSIRENIRLGRPGATDAEVEAAAGAAELHEIALALPEGYDTRVGERGGRLSGGQRQRVAIARALVRDPRILVLDEATSALDPATEAALNETLLRASRGRTLISVTHRLASITHFDRILAFDKGRLIESGTHVELLAAGGVYARLWGKQAGVSLSSDFETARVRPEWLRQVAMLQELAPNVLEELAARFQTETAAAGDKVVRQGEPGSKFYIVVRGKLRVTVERGGKVREVGALIDGDHFGEIALLEGAPRNATVEAQTASILLSLRRPDFSSLLREHPAVEAAIRAAAERRKIIAEMETGDRLRKVPSAQP